MTCILQVASVFNRWLANTLGRYVEGNCTSSTDDLAWERVRGVQFAHSHFIACVLCFVLFRFESAEGQDCFRLHPTGLGHNRGDVHGAVQGQSGHQLVTG